MKSAQYFDRLFSRLLAQLGHGEEVGIVVRGAASFMVIRVGGAGLAFLSQVLLAQWMGPFEYGIFTYAWIWVVVLSVLAPVGFDTAIVRFVSEYKAKGQLKLVSGVIRGGQLIVLVGGLLFAAIGAAFVLSFSDNIATYYLAPFYVCFASVPLFALLTFYMNLARSFDWVGLAFVPIYITRNALLIIGAGGVLLAGRAASAETMAYIAFLACLISLSGQALVFRKRLPDNIRRAPRAYRPSTWLRVSFPLFLVGSSTLVVVNTDILMLGAYVEPDAVGIYNAALRSAGLVNFMLIAVTALAGPRYSALSAQGKYEDLRALVSAVIQWVFWPSMLLSVGLVLFGEFILSLFGPTFVAGYTPLLILVLGHLFVGGAGGVIFLLSLTGSQKICAAVVAGSAVVNITLNAILIPLYGLTGAAIATLVSQSFNTLCLVAVARRRLGIHSFIIPLPVKQAQPNKPSG